MKVEIATTLEDFPDDALGPIDNPFASPKFFKLCEKSKVVGANSGWNPVYFIAKENEKIVGLLPAFIKTNSFGEFIFDWAWADLYQRSGIPYYPKLTAATPFTPVNAPKVLGSKKKATDALMDAFSQFLEKNPGLSSAHALFISKRELEDLKKHNFFERVTIQYHLEVNFKGFDDYLDSLKARKRKQIKKERQAVIDSGVEIELIENEFSEDLMKDIYLLYLSTIDKKWSQAYLNESFFLELARDFKDNLVIYLAKKNDELIAMSLFLKSKEALYGRYWGCKTNCNIAYLHFELSYYKGIEYCIKHCIPLFEAGAQGEQKLLRGFRPVEIHSAHKLKIEQAHEAIEKHVKTENAFHIEQIKELERHLPFKKI